MSADLQRRMRGDCASGRLAPLRVYLALESGREEQIAREYPALTGNFVQPNAADGSGRIVVWDASDGTFGEPIVLDGTHSPSLMELAWTPDGDGLAVETMGRRLLLSGRMRLQATSVAFLGE